MIEQNTKEWLEYRKSHVGSSDCPIILGLSKYGQTPLKLWMEKMDMAKPRYVNKAMQRGHELEPKAREKFCQYIGEKFSPVVLEHRELPWMSASLDGLSEDGQKILEIKTCSGDVFKSLKREEIRDDWYAQMQHGMEVAGVDRGYLWVWCEDLEENFYAEVYKHTTFVHGMIKKEEEFYYCLVNETPPPPLESEIPECEDQEGIKVMNELMKIKTKIKCYQNLEKKLSDSLKNIAGNDSMRFGEYTLVKSYQQGRVNYKDIPDIENVDLDQYRSEPIEMWRIK